MSLHDHIVARIRAEGPMRLDDYMQSCLLHPRWGYYATRDPLGAAGDFTTAPEISQMFGEVIGLSLAQKWLDDGAPAPFTLAELGPGRGTLMADILRACAQVPGFIDAAEIHLIEASDSLRQIQAQTLKAARVTWSTDIGDLPEQPLYLVANEFFDALPIRQFVREGTRWRERQVGLQDGTLALGLGPAQPQPALKDRIKDTHDGNVVEICGALSPILSQIATRIANHGGAAVIIDYGDWHTLGDTWQAVQDHAPADPLADPGAADLTAHVDFEAIALAAAPCAYSRVTPQGVFLERLGITQRAQQLAQALTGPALDSHIAAHRRLTHPQEMGNLFKVIALYPPESAPPPGLEP
ncbi:methyltransferase [Sulfitobacter sp. EhC04]|uniref:class I SAM-dependent methyltransferase n=1 Tax=Sulfitobacter sp. EhC04 TaxID=1849168 RepID=UPI0007F45490|nr:SAM-dependent methyltransferase [Sulfitobacter sp. EhC04]OAN80591.1 methyltransferase [Sulfitobacter sp. EhC04]